MPKATLEQINLTVSDPESTANLLCTLFDWKIRWSGDAKLGRQTYHVGETCTYLAIYTLHGPSTDSTPEFGQYRGGLNHVGVLVDDLEEVEKRVGLAWCHTPMPTTSWVSGSTSTMPTTSSMRWLHTHDHEDSHRDRRRREATRP